MIRLPKEFRKFTFNPMHFKCTNATDDWLTIDIDPKNPDMATLMRIVERLLTNTGSVSILFFQILRDFRVIQHIKRGLLLIDGISAVSRKSKMFHPLYGILCLQRQPVWRPGLAQSYWRLAHDWRYSWQYVRPPGHPQLGS